MTEQTAHDIAQRVRTARIKMEFSFQDLAKRTGMSKSTLQRYETGGIKNIPLDKLKILSDALQVTPEYIMGWDEKEEPPMPELSEEDSSKLEALLEIVDTLTDDEWNRLMEYAVLLLNARKNSKVD